LRRWLRLLTAVFMLVLCIGLQPVASFSQQFLIHNYENNVPSLDVMGVSQDKDGLMWFATRAGMVRYDGTSWEISNPGTENPLQSYRHVVADSSGRIWSLAMNLPFLINSFDGLRWTSHEIPPLAEWTSNVVDFAVDARPDGTVLMAIASEKILSFWDGEKWHQFGSLESIARIRSLLFLDGELYVATADGLQRLDSSQLALGQVKPHGMPEGPVQALAGIKDEEHGLWLVGADWVGILRNGHFRPLDAGLEFDFGKIEKGTSALAGPAGGLFLGGVEGFFHYHPQRGLMKLGRANGFISGGISDFFLDREQNVWVTSSRGISKLVSMRIQTFDSRFGLTGDEVSAITQLPDGSMVLGHEGGLTFLDPDPMAFPIKRDTPGIGRVMDLETDPQGQLWVGFDQWGLARLNPDRSLSWLGVEDGLPEYVYAVHFDQNGEMWVGGSLGLYKKTGEQFEKVLLTETDSDPQPNMFVRRINRGPNGSLLVSTGKLGAFEYQDGAVKWWAKALDGIQTSCFQVFDHGEGDYWIATSAGLCRERNGELELLTSPEPEIRRPVYNILKDSQGIYWFGTDRGVMRWDGHTLTTINNLDGIVGREFNRDALLQSKDGRIWMGTDRGLSIYDLRFELTRKTEPLVEIQSPLVDGEVVQLKGNTELEPSLYELVFPFRGISFLDENRVMFRTWLEGLEPDWQPYQEFPTRKIRYTNLPAGQYRFHVQARNPAGQEGARVSTEFFRVGKYFTQTWWFTLLEVVFGLVVALGVLFLLMGRRYQKQLQSEVLQRTQELRLTERAVRSESQRLFSILSSISDGVLAIDQNQKVVISNPMVLFILGLRLDEVVGRNLGEVLKVEPPLTIDLEASRSKDEDIPIYRFSGDSRQQRFLEISVASMTGNGDDHGGWVLAFRDVTDRQNRNRELIRTQQLESLGVLAGGIAHDFNNLLTIMLGNLSLVQNAEIYGEDEKNRLERMKNATLRAQGLAEQLLTFAKGGDPKMQSVDLGELVKQSTAFALSGAKVSSRIRIPDGLWPVLGDPGQLGQVVNNLVINAMQAMPEGGTMQMELRNLMQIPGSKDGGRCVCMEVIDKGEGIAPADLERIFNPYFSTKGTGSGLGLTIAHSIVAHHGGLIQADSELGRGTAVRVYLPAVTSVSDDFKSKGSSELPVGMRALILDDEKDVVLLAEQMLRRLGVKCVGVTDGEEAVQAFALAIGQNKPFSLFIADLTIPGGLGGVGAFEKIRAMDNTVKGIVISGYSNDTVMANYEEYGFSAAVRKPFEQSQLIDSLNQAFRESGD